MKLKVAETGNFIAAEIALFLPKEGSDHHFAFWLKVSHIFF